MRFASFYQTHTAVQNAIIIDGEYLSRACTQFRKFLQQTIGREIPEADLARWLEYAALDGGVRPEDKATTQVYIFHEPATKLLKGFKPADLYADFDGKAFNGPVGEFLLAACPAQDDLGSKETLLCETLQSLLKGNLCKHFIIVADHDAYGIRIEQLLADYPNSPVTLLTLKKESGSEGTSIPLPYSLMAACGVSGSELP